MVRNVLLHSKQPFFALDSLYIIKEVSAVVAMTKKTPKNFRFKPETVNLIDRAAKATGITQTQLIEMLITDHLPNVVKNLSGDRIAGMLIALKEYQKSLK